jgi:hypothetical protein
VPAGPVIRLLTARQAHLEPDRLLETPGPGSSSADHACTFSGGTVDLRDQFALRDDLMERLVIDP